MGLWKLIINGGFMIKYKALSTPLGEMLAADCDGKICLLDFSDCSGKKHLVSLEKYYGEKAEAGETALLRKLEKQLAAYFGGKLKDFDLPLVFTGTDFQKSVWKRLREIPYGQTVNYGTIAAKLGSPSASRAVGRANGSNPISIVVPCHRVIGKDGALVGYGGKMWRKKWLLEHEGALQPSAV
jgi:AraC family transcriptional regulator, regulatory protein of adaptative response / methylated-DNA-[protein]-cysteine methyltransferase